MTQLEAYIMGSSGIRPDVKVELMALVREKNCSFHCFKASGKWYTSEEGFIDESVFGSFGKDRLSTVLELNGDRWPGLSTEGKDLFRIALPHERLDYGFPQMYLPDV